MRHHTSKMSLTVFLGVLLGVSTLAVVRPEPPAQTRRMETWRVDDTQSLTFPLPQRTGQFLLWTAAERDESIPNDLTLEHRYGVTLTWRDGEGAVLREDPLWLASPIVVVQPFPVRATQASDVLVPVTAWISLPDDLAGRARTVEIRVPDALHAVRVRLYQRVIEAFDSPEARLARIDERTSALLADRVDLPWDELTREEAVELAGSRWRSLSPLVLGQPRDVAVKTQLPAQHLALSARRVLAEDVRPGQSVSWRIPGPVDALLLYDGPDDAFVATAVRENAGEAEVTLLPSQPPPWWPNAKALRLRVPGEGETSLTIHAIQAGRVDRMMLLLDPRDARGLDDRAHAVAVDDLIAGSGGDASKPGDPRLALVPPRIELRLPRATPERVVRYALPGAPGRTSLRLTLRPIARDGVAPQGTALVTYEVPPAPGRGAPPPTTVPLTWTLAPYERARPGASEADAFDGVALDVAEPIQVELEIPPGAVGLRVQYQGEGPGALVGASLLGPRRAGDPLVDEARLTRLRYPPEAPSSWVPLVHDPIVDGLEGEAAWRFLANTRRELVTEAPEEDAPRGRRATEARVARPIAEGTPTPKAAPEEPARSPRRYRTAPRPAGVSTRGWLVQPDPEAGARGTGWCRFPANAPAARSPWDARAFAELDGVLAVRVWAPGAATHDPQLGGSVMLRLDGVQWANLGLTAGVLDERRRREASRQFQVTGTPGTEVWVRTWFDGPIDCDDAWLGRTLVALPLDGAARWTLPASAAGTRILIGGVASAGAEIDVAIGGQAARYALPTTERRATQLDAPWSSGWLLDSVALMVPPPLPGADTIEVAVTAHAGEVDLQVLIEDGALTPPTVEEDD